MSNSGASQEAIEFHYDMPASFFALWLGQGMTYNAARYYGPDITLNEAQADKITHHLNAAGVDENHRMLDIGCGWGTLLNAGMRDRGAGEAIALTLRPLSRDCI